jgi:hypothetical protein
MIILRGKYWQGMQHAWDQLKMHIKFGYNASWEEIMWEIQVYIRGAEEWHS